MKSSKTHAYLNTIKYLNQLKTKMYIRQITNCIFYNFIKNIGNMQNNINHFIKTNNLN